MPWFRVDPTRASGHPGLRILGFLARRLVRTVGSTLRFDVVEGAERLDELLSANRPVLYVIWHNRAITTVCWLSSPRIRKRIKIAIMASQSQDGQIVTNIARPWPIRVVRGSATRGGRAALRQLHRVITQEELPSLLAPDGPKGPKYQFKVGVGVLAQMANVPIVPLGLMPQEAFRLRSWDRLFVPKFFSRVAIAVGEPIEVPRGIVGAELEQVRLRLEKALTSVNRTAQESADIKRKFELEYRPTA
ncbi:MAG: lysophospholipid acyltransferase family protein [Planctomycetota bacterium]|jgi:lysophospholipid acyltransferase (LPLAT)-like uncharacterized protein